MSTYLSQSKKASFNVSTLDAPSYLKEYLNYQVGMRNLAPNTVDTYYIQLREFLRWTQCRYDPEITKEAFAEIKIAAVPFSVIEDITASDIYEFLAFASAVLGNTASSKALKITALNKFFQFFTTVSPRLKVNPLEGVSSPKKEDHLPVYLTLDQSQKVLETAKANPATLSFPERDYCILTFFLNCGMRVAELVGIDMSDIKEDRMTLYGKGRRERVIFLNEACKTALADYLAARAAISGANDEPALFISKQRKKRVTRRRVQQIVEDSYAAAGLSGMGVSTHKLRHTAATLMYQHGGVDVMALQSVLGHRSVATTEIYTHIDPQQVRDAVERSPLATFHVEDSNGEDEG